MNILITNQCLIGGSGTEIVTRDLALELKKLGHRPLIYAPTLGPLADDVRAQDIPVFSAVQEIQPVPDVIHGHHHPQVLAALLRFPETPAITVCHDATAWQDDPLIVPRVLRYVAVDDRCRKRWQDNPRLAGRNIQVILNAVNLARFTARPPLPEKPRRAAIFSNYATHRTHVPAIRHACDHAAITLDVIGQGFNTATSHPENILPQYDLVFAKARCALESMATGAAVVLCDSAGLGGMVSSDRFDALRRLNFGAGTLTHPLDPLLIATEIRKYDAYDARLVSERTRREASLTSAIAEWVNLYEEVMAEWQQRDQSPQAGAAHEMAGVAAYLETWGYGARVAWEKVQLERLQHWPILGRSVTWVMNRAQARLSRK